MSLLWLFQALWGLVTKRDRKVDRHREWWGGGEQKREKEVRGGSGGRRGGSDE